MEVLRGVDLTIRPGDLLSIMGPSGCGKSTLMNIIGLLDQQTSGTRWLDGRMIKTMTDDEVSAVRNARIGFVFQAFHLLPRLTAAQNAGLPLLYRGMREGEVRTRALAALETVDMAERSEHRPGQLSGGQQQRVALARALIGGPSIILADEPTGAPDPDTAAEVMATFERLCDEQRIAVVIVTHSPEVEARCRWRTRLEDGLPRETARGLTAVRGRSALALVGIVVGIGSVIAMVSTGEIVREQAMKQFEALGTDIVTARTYYSQRLRRLVTFPLDAIMAIEAEIAEIETAGWNETNARLSHRGRDIEGAGILGVTGSFADVAGLEVAEGRFVSDLDARQRYCVVGAGIARAMRDAGAQSALGQRLVLAGQLWSVIGVLVPSGSSRFNYAPDQSVYIPVRAAALFTDQDAVGDVIARVWPGVETEAGAQAMLAYLRASAEGIEVKAKTAEQLIAGMRRQGRLFTVLLAAVGGIALVVGGVGIMNVMLISVSERRGEIGLRRAVGARRRDIRRQFVLEAVLLCTTGGLLGIGAGVTAAWGICLYTGWPFSVSVEAMVVGVGVSTGAGLLFGVYPALQAARLDPIAALRS